VVLAAGVVLFLIHQAAVEQVYLIKVMVVVQGSVHMMAVEAAVALAIVAVVVAIVAVVVAMVLLQILMALQ
jgi:hypothetical protein